MALEISRREMHCNPERKGRSDELPCAIAGFGQAVIMDGLARRDGVSAFQSNAGCGKSLGREVLDARASENGKTRK
jgi:hypothetical protein